MSELRVHDMSISLDGYGAGPRRSVDDPLGVGGDQLHEWAFVDDAPEVDRRFRKRGTEGIEAALDRARAAAGGQDARLGGGVATVQEYLRAGLVDELHVVVVPVLLHGGERLFDNLDGSLEGRACVEVAPSRSVTHVRLRRR